MQSDGHDHGLFLAMEKSGSSPLTGHSQRACHCTEHLNLFFVWPAPPAMATNSFFMPPALAYVVWAFGLTAFYLQDSAHYRRHGNLLSCALVVAAHDIYSIWGRPQLIHTLEAVVQHRSKTITVNAFFYYRRVLPTVLSVVPQLVNYSLGEHIEALHH